MKPSRFLLPYLSVALLLMAGACQHTEPRETGRYGIITFTGEDSEEEYLITTDSLTGGFLKIPKGSERIYSLIFSCHGGYYYGIDDGKPVFTRYKATPGGLKADAQLPFHDVPWRIFQSWYNWIDETTLFLGSTMNGRKFVYSLIDVRKMELTARGELDIPPLSEGYYGGVMGQFRDNRLLVAYTRYLGWDNPAPVSDTTYLAVIDYPSLKTLAIHKDTRSTWPGGIYLHGPTSFIDESGDIYLVTAPGGRTHHHPTARPGIYRIRKGEETFDPDYFLPVAGEGREAYLLFDIGDGKALVRTVDRSLIRQYEDYLYKPVAGYSLADLKNGSVRKLDLPTGILDFTETVLVENGKVYIVIAENKKESYIWEYDPVSEKITRGAKIEGRVMVLNRIKEQ